MIKRLKNLVNKKYFHMAIISIIFISILFIVAVIILRYQVEGETNMPFQLSKISIISSSEGIDKEVVDSRWAFDVYQSNDVYIYIDKNEDYHKTEAIKSVIIDHIQIEGKKKDNIKIYQPDEQDEKLIFKNKEENIVEKIEYRGDMESNIKEQRISNQGGVIAFRCSNDNLVTYTSNEEAEIHHRELLKKAGVEWEDLAIKMTFDLTIQLEKGKQYQSSICLDFPVKNIIEEGTTSIEITDLRNFVFKRVNN